MTLRSQTPVWERTCPGNSVASAIEQAAANHHIVSMASDVRKIEQAIRLLPRLEVERLREWIESFLEDQLELTDDFEASIERGKSDIATRDRMPRF
jgi:hypothetical protein